MLSTYSFYQLLYCVSFTFVLIYQFIILCMHTSTYHLETALLNYYTFIHKDLEGGGVGGGRVGALSHQLQKKKGILKKILDPRLFIGDFINCTFFHQVLQVK